MGSVGVGRAGRAGRVGRAGRAVGAALVAVALCAGAIVPVSAAPAAAPEEDSRTPLSEVGKTPEPQVPERTWDVGGRGSFQDRIAISVPPWHDVAPVLSLDYDSSAGNSWVGMGWTLSGASRITRVGARQGAPRYDGTDTFTVDGQELVACAPGSASPSCAAGGTHSTENESYARFALTGTGAASRWTVTAKDGSKRVYAPVLLAGPDLVHRWGVSQVVDTSGNTTTYTWGSNRFGCCWDHLDSIAYNGTAITLHYEPRPDPDQEAIGNGALTTALGRVKTIDVTVDGARLRSYQLSYTTSASTSRSLLTAVRQFGRDATLDASGTVTGGTALPATTATYQAGTPGFTATGNDTTMPSHTGAKYLSLDVNGDGRTDMLELYPGWSYERKTWLSTGSGFTLASTATDLAYNADTRFLDGDVTGDGKADLIELFPYGTSWGRRVWVSTGTGFTAGAVGYSKGPFNKNSRFLDVDVNGDGRTDVLELYSCGFYPLNYCRATWLSDGSGFTLGADEAGIPYDVDRQFLPLDADGDGRTDLLEVYSAGFGAGGRHLWLSNGTGFTSGATDTAMGWSTPTADGSGSRFLTLDVNADHKTDLVELLPSGLTYTRRTWLSTGFSFVLGGTDTSMPAGTTSRHLAVDVNGDHRVDLVEVYPCCFSASAQRRTWVSTSTGFTLGTSDTGMGSFSCSKGSCGSDFLPMDVNGDGMVEMVELYTSGWNRGRRVWSIGGSTPDLLTSRTGEWGATTSVAYTPSSAWANSNNPPITQSATAVTEGDGRGTDATTRFAYSGGAYDWSERVFLGHRAQRETLPCTAGETACPYTETRYRQDLAAIAEPERVEWRTGAGALLSSQDFEFTTNGATIPRTALLTGTWETAYTGAATACPGADCKRKHTSRQYNAHGEVTQEVEHGDEEVTGDERTTVRTFVPNTAAYIVGKPAVETVRAGVGPSGAKLTEKRHHYDGATTWDQAPTKGLETKTGDWLSTSDSFVEQTQEHDAWGNLTARVNPLGARTAMAYDPAHHQYQVAETNALSQQVTAEWDAVCGLPTRVTDVNGQATTMTYDALCRLARKDSPGGEFEAHSWVDVGNPASQHERVEEPAADGTGTPRWTKRYLDGLQRPWRTVEKGPDAATGDIHEDTTYNPRGQIAATTAKYYWVAGQPKPTTYATTNDYDAIDRLTKVTTPDGATQTKRYGLWSTTTTDERGHVSVDRVDAQGRRTAHEEVIGGATTTATYAYDLRGYLTRSTDPAGGVITYTTDSLGRETRVDDPDAGTTTHEWDAAGRSTAQVDALGQRTVHTYDALDRKTSKTTRAGTAGAVTVTWAYDQQRAGFHNTGEVTSTTDPSGTSTTDYDQAGRAVKRVRTTGGTAYTFQHGFDPADRPLWTTYPDGTTVGTPAAPLRYDGAGRLAAVPGFVTAARYTADGELARLENANGTVTTRSHDPGRGWLTGISTALGATTIQDLAYTRDARGKITRITAPTPADSWTYTYDDAGRLTGATNGVAANNQTLTYDGAGNITGNSRLGAYGYAASRPHAATSAGPHTYAYNAVGAMTAGAGRTLTWDGDNRLAGTTRAGTTTTFSYDADGERLAQTTGGATRRYFGDDYEVDVATGTATVLVRVGTTVVARSEGGARRWVHTDHLGSVQAETDATGAQVHRSAYRPFGEVLSATGTSTRGFTGKPTDASGLVYLDARYYDPELGRFTAPNPVVDGADNVGLNRYAYAANDPVNHTDPTGLDCEEGGKRCDRENYNKPNWQQNGWYCGPAAVQVALSAQGVIKSQDEIASALGTTTDGTASSYDTRRVLNQMLGTTYYDVKLIGGSTATPEQRETLKNDIVQGVLRNHLPVVNVAGTATDTDGDSHSYAGGHYLTVTAFDDHGDKVKIADSADSHGVGWYWISTGNLADWIATRGYAA
ncbi:RHS repeat-associated core domain-containing protein [Actinokineospora bangkokensis]|uniref:Peptidase C39-like domain-containing protein n=1 Tax=Actinokineospora bangkokensis TaxID=1193682 RepID=A0A1Q9LIH3_9PSEU|nr:RHS repeat-associated core domain-containing protein [Actinokineospora bangkokensis]OLR91813.1 hypothetical protein BJP25_23520 [Actinokineospora bangkokensis]